jgi:hypothetical protein
MDLVLKMLNDIKRGIVAFVKRCLLHDKDNAVGRGVLHCAMNRTADPEMLFSPAVSVPEIDLPYDVAFRYLISLYLLPVSSVLSYMLVGSKERDIDCMAS